MPSDKTTIKIPRNLYDKINSHIEETGFSSATQFIVHVLRDLLAGGGIEPDGLSQEEIRKIRKRLERLGYLDR